MFDFLNDPAFMDALIEKGIEYAPYIGAAAGVLIAPIYIIISNSIGNNSHSNFNVTKYVQDFEKFKHNTTIKDNKNNGLF